MLFAHTQDDLAETFLMRLARGSGVEGLSAMAATRHVQLDPSHDGFHIIRPLMGASRAELRHHINVLKVPYVDDPSNDDPRFDRVKARKALAGLGIDASTLAETAHRMARAAHALRLRAAEVAHDVVTEDHGPAAPTGDLLIDRDGFATVERDTQLRLLAAALQWVASAEYRPRAAPLEALLDRALAGGDGTLHGARAIVTPRQIRICREYEAVREIVVPFSDPGQTVWDHRWHAGGPLCAGMSLRALGPEGWQHIPDKPANAPPHDAAISLPAAYDGARLLACPALRFGPEIHLRLVPPAGSFVASLLSH